MIGADSSFGTWALGFGSYSLAVYLGFESWDLGFPAPLFPWDLGFEPWDLRRSRLGI
jgi:hypothetical protein